MRSLRPTGLCVPGPQADLPAASGHPGPSAVRGGLFSARLLDSKLYFQLLPGGPEIRRLPTRGPRALAYGIRTK